MPPLMWRSLEELAASDEFRERLRREFPAGAEVWFEGVSRVGMTAGTSTPEPVIQEVRAWLEAL